MSDHDIEAGEIAGAFVPHPRADVSCVELDGEMVMSAPGEDGESTQFDVHWLDRTAAIIWNCLDGATSLDELADDLSAAFSTSRDVVLSDVVELARTLGRRGLLEGVAREQPPRRVPPQLTSVPVGTELPTFTLLDLAGRERTSEEMRGRRLLLLNWDTACGFCRNIADEVGSLQHDLGAQGVGVVVITRGADDDTRQLQQAWGVDCTVLIQDDYALFSGLGTPAAYLADADGRIEAELALGAPDVAALARRAAGRDADR